jgi:hypothetical protein
MSLDRTNRGKWGGRGEKSVQGFGGKVHEKLKSEVRGIDEKMGSKLILGRLTGVCRVDSVGSV